MNKRMFALCAVLGILSWKCSSGGGDGPPAKTPAEYLAEGWAAYSNHNYALALTDFNASAQGNANLVDAFNGAGWANAKLNALDASVVDFRDALTKEAGNVQVMAGLSLVFNAQKLYDSSIVRAGATLSASPGFVFSRDTSVNAADFHLLLAEDYYALTPPQFGNSLHQVQVLNAAFTADTLTVQGQTELAAEIERLGTIY